MSTETSNGSRQGIGSHTSTATFRTRWRATRPSSRAMPPRYPSRIIASTSSYAVDVFEHIPAAQRTTFLREIARVGRRGLILGAPFDSPGVHAVEQSANGFYRALSGLEHPWLREHLDNGLPDLGRTRAQLESLGLQVDTFAHGEVGLWLALTQAHFAESVYPDVAPKVKAIYRMYARDVYASDVRRALLPPLLVRQP